jgi:hypothetical protein
MHSREQVPVACTLDMQSMGPRVGEIQRLTREHLRAHRVEGRTLRLTYGPEAASEVARIVELERVCCAFLDFDLNESADVVELSIAAPEQDGSDAQWLFAQFLPAAALPGVPATRASDCACSRD